MRPTLDALRYENHEYHAGVPLGEQSQRLVLEGRRDEVVDRLVQSLQHRFNLQQFVRGPSYRTRLVPRDAPAIEPPEKGFNFSLEIAFPALAGIVQAHIQHGDVPNLSIAAEYVGEIKTVLTQTLCE